MRERTATKVKAGGARRVSASSHTDRMAHGSCPRLSTGDTPVRMRCPLRTRLHRSAQDATPPQNPPRANNEAVSADVNVSPRPQRDDATPQTRRPHTLGNGRGAACHSSSSEVRTHRRRDTSAPRQIGAPGRRSSAQLSPYAAMRRTQITQIIPPPAQLSAAPSSAHAELIVAVLRNVPDPRQSLVARFLDDLEVAHLDA